MITLGSNIVDTTTHSRLGYEAAIHEVRRAISLASAPTWRPIAEFAESEIILPTGPHKGERFSIRTQPFIKLLYSEIASGRWNEYITIGPSQSGKTLAAFVIVILWYLFEQNEDVICAAPTMPICRDKYLRDILPVLSLSRYERHIPTKGTGARGGFAELIQFGNGATLRFMSGGGDDKSVAGYTSRVIVITETDGFKSESTSVETDKIAQIEARAKSFGRRKQIYKECTVSTEDGHVWKRYNKGTASKIYVKCQKCGVHTHLTRESLQGWLDCDTELDAEESSQFFCSECGEGWTEYDRLLAVRNAVLVHRGQTVINGEVVGDLPKTRTLGFRWSAPENLLLTQSELGAEEWSANQAGNTDDVERKMHQFVWAMPYKDPDLEISEIDAQSVSRRVSKDTRGVIPNGVDWVTVGIDVQKRYLYWTVMAHYRGVQKCHIVDYGRCDVETDTLGLDEAMHEALIQFRERIAAGFGGHAVRRVMIDCGGFTEQIYRFLQDPKTNRKLWLGSLGRGHGNRWSKYYNRPTRTTAVVRKIYDGAHLKFIKARKIFVIEYHSDLFKSRVHDGLRSREDHNKMTLPAGLANEHMPFTTQLASEKQQEKYIPGKGNVVVWTQSSKQNHWLDSTCMAKVCGWMLNEECGKKRAKLPKMADTEGQENKFRGLRE